ncbi:MAG TPA: alpha/beta fold hydrolase [Candidatus Poseidoniia archaeon]|jgi:predicted alpha/beta hydrolase family esterase|nr:alpha/beta fold hydrolase [Candidatus Poseidoniia archaeon]MDP7665466.1 alpha/beta fold hydrolase [Candidatus Poseidoniia archaeon]HJL72114.1 alpha/beta fold hydrolase [Candidatus Poseidoniia archaeon]|tara:strand:+ start:438 stop:965 length:528 start_codon:yes stop_codon:yes gene_type:complete
MKIAYYIDCVWGIMLVWAHGLWGSPNGSKVTAIRESGIEVISPDFNEMELVDRVELLKETIDVGDVVLAGSSWGGLACALTAQEKPEKLRGLLLLAPALHYPEHPNDVPEKLIAPDNVPVTIIHSTTDDIVPISASKDYIERSGNNVQLIEVEDNHVLEDSIELIISEAKKLLNG